MKITSAGLVWLLIVARLPAMRAAEPAGGMQIVQMPAVSVVASRVDDFYLSTDGKPVQRLWLKTVADRREAAMYAGFQGAGVRDGDEIIRIAGRLVKEMAPGEASHSLFSAFSGRGPDRVEIEVLTKGERKARKVTLVRTLSPATVVPRPVAK